MGIAAPSHRRHVRGRGGDLERQFTPGGRYYRSNGVILRTVAAACRLSMAEVGTMVIRRNGNPLVAVDLSNISTDQAGISEYLARQLADLCNRLIREHGLEQKLHLARLYSWRDFVQMEGDEHPEALSA